MATIELKFEPGVIEVEGRAPIKYEWALQQVNANNRMVFHFFLGLKRKDPDFTLALLDAVQTVTNVTYSIYYTDEFDGHDLIINNINPFAKLATHNTVVKELKKALTKK